jgi:hypothetical protein
MPFLYTTEDIKYFILQMEQKGFIRENYLPFLSKEIEEQQRLKVTISIDDVISKYECLKAQNKVK